MGEQLSIEQRVARQEAIQAIHALKHRYWRACDGKDPEGVRDCFTEDADINFEGLGHFKGRDELVDYYSGLALRKLDDGRYAYNEMHMGHHGDVAFNSDTEATGQWSLQFVRADLLEESLQFEGADLSARTFTVISCEYDDTYVLVHGEWKMSQCHSRPLTMIIQPLSEPAFVQRSA
jgi:ketosteroid isomerase-like protein